MFCSSLNLAVKLLVLLIFHLVIISICSDVKFELIVRICLLSGDGLDNTGQ